MNWRLMKSELRGGGCECCVLGTMTGDRRSLNTYQRCTLQIFSRHHIGCRDEMQSVAGQESIFSAILRHSPVPKTACKSWARLTCSMHSLSRSLLHFNFIFDMLWGANDKRYLREPNKALLRTLEHISLQHSPNWPLRNTLYRQMILQI